MSEPQPPLTLGDVDADGAIADALGRLHGSTRAEALRAAALGGAALLGAAAGAPAAFAAGGAGKRRDVAILSFALLLEHLQADFYTEVERNKVLHGGLARQARIVGAHERAHVKALSVALGSKAPKAPRFDFGGATDGPTAFRRTAVAFEDLAVAAYKGQAPRISSRAYLASALSIHSVEARHAAWIRRLAGARPVQGAFDEPKSGREVVGIVERTKFIVQTRRKGKPHFTG
jgi:Ferritin-like domain